MDPKKLDELTTECVYGKRPDVCACTNECQYLHGGPIARCRRIIGEEKPRGTVTEHGTLFDEGITVMKDVRRTDLSEKSIRLSDLLPNVLPNAPQVGGRKDDTGKLPWHLIPWDAVRSIVKVLQFGAAKYAPRNWEKGMDWERPYAACIRHLTDWWERAPSDPETGFSHLWHAGCCIVFLIAYEIRGVGKDTRP